MEQKAARTQDLKAAGDKAAASKKSVGEGKVARKQGAGTGAKQGVASKSGAAAPKASAVSKPEAVAPSKGQPLVSVIIPVYNAQDSLGQCLVTILGQTHTNLEIICVDDGSTDTTPEILSGYAKSDARVKVITQKNGGPGIARNVGIDAAQGEYLYFFDSDDWCEPNLISSALERMQQTQADIVVLPFYTFDQRVRYAFPAHWALLRDKFPGEVVSWHDNPDWLFRAFENFPWGKMMRASFVREHHLRFQEDVYLTEDLMFSAPALVCAKRISCLDECLIYHREGTGANAMADKDKHPLDFYKAFYALKRYLEDEGLYGRLRVAYANWAVDSCMYNLNTLNTYEGFTKALHKLVDEGGLSDLGLLNFDKRNWQSPTYEQFIEDVQKKPQLYLYDLYVRERNLADERKGRVVLAEQTAADCTQRTRVAEETAREAVECARAYEAQLRACQEELASLRVTHETQMNAAEQKVGKAVCWLPRKVQWMFIKHKH